MISGYQFIKQWIPKLSNKSDCCQSHFLPNKTEPTYNRLSSLLKDSMTQRNFLFSPEKFMLDFEVASINVIQVVLPLTIVKACFFHYAHCTWRKTQSCGLMSKYKQYDNVKKLLRRAAVLPLIPIQQVENI